MLTYEHARELINDRDGRPQGKRSSVRYGDTFRLDKAREQLKKPPPKIEDITDYVNEFLTAVGIPAVSSPKYTMNGKSELSKEEYEAIRVKNDLADKRDIVWMKFDKDGYPVVVAASSDVNFDMPASKEEYTIKAHGIYKVPSTGVLLHLLGGKEFDTSFVLIFPLSGISDRFTRKEIENGIGNYLLEKGVPILDYYSHNY